MSDKKNARKRSKLTGVYTRTSSLRRFEGRPDIYYEITYKANGKKVWEKVGWRSEGYSAQLASQIRAERLRMVRNGELVDTRQELTFGQAWEMYDRDYLPAISNAYTDRGLYRNHLRDRLQHKKLSQITLHDMEVLRDERLSAGLSPQSVKHILALVRRVYRKLISWRHYSGPIPTDGLKMPTVNNERFRYLSRDEAGQLLNEIRKCSLKTWRQCILGLYAGLRAGEIFSLRGQAIDLAAETIHILDAKGGKSRDVPMCSAVVEMLQGLGELPPAELVFPSRSGGRSERISSVFPRTVERLGLNRGVTDTRGRVVFHTLRHTFASWLAIDGIPLYVIGDLMGHGSEAMTRRYAHLCPDLRRQAVRSLVSVDQESAPL